MNTFFNIFCTLKSNIFKNLLLTLVYRIFKHRKNNKAVWSCLAKSKVLVHKKRRTIQYTKSKIYYYYVALWEDGGCWLCCCCQWRQQHTASKRVSTCAWWRPRPSSSWWPRTFFFFANRGSQYDIIYLLLYSLLRIFFFSFFSSKTYDKIKNINKNELLGIFFLFSSHILGFGSSCGYQKHQIFSALGFSFLVTTRLHHYLHRYFWSPNQSSA